MESFVIELDGRASAHEAPIVEASVKQELFEQALILEVAANSSSFIKHRFKQAKGETVLRKAKSDGERKQTVDAFIALWRKNLIESNGDTAEEIMKSKSTPLVHEDHSQPQRSYQTSKYFQDIIPSASGNLATWVEQGLRSHYQSFLAVECSGKPPLTMAQPRTWSAVMHKKEVTGEGTQKANRVPISSQLGYTVDLTDNGVDAGEPRIDPNILHALSGKKTRSLGEGRGTSGGTTPVITAPLSSDKPRDTEQEQEQMEEDEETLRMQYLGYPFLGQEVYYLYLPVPSDASSVNIKASVIQILPGTTKEGSRPLGTAPERVRLHLHGGGQSTEREVVEVDWSPRSVSHVGLDFRAYLAMRREGVRTGEEDGYGGQGRAESPTSSSSSAASAGPEAISTLYDIALGREGDGGPPSCREVHGNRSAKNRGDTHGLLGESDEDEDGEESEETKEARQRLSLSKMLAPGDFRERGPTLRQVIAPSYASEHAKNEIEVDEEGVDVVFYRGYQRRYATMMAKMWIARHGPLSEAHLSILEAGEVLDTQGASESSRDVDGNIREALAKLARCMKPSALDKKLLAQRMIATETKAVRTSGLVPLVTWATPPDAGRDKGVTEGESDYTETADEPEPTSGGRKRNRNKVSAPAIQVALSRDGVSKYLRAEETEGTGGSTDSLHVCEDMLVGSTPSLNLRFGRPIKFPLRQAVHIYAPRRNRGEEEREMPEGGSTGEEAGRRRQGRRQMDRGYWEVTEVILRTDKSFPQD